MTHPSNGKYFCRFSRASDTDAIYDFYAAADRPNTVYLRQKDVLAEQISSGFVFGIWQQQNERQNLVAASSLYCLADDLPIRILADDALHQKQSAWELGSLLKKEGNSSTKPKLREVQKLLLMLPILELFRRVTENGVRADILVADVFKTSCPVANCFTQQPLGWKMMEGVSNELVSAKAATVDDRNFAPYAVDYFRFPPAQIFAIAKHFLALLDADASGQPIYKSPGADTPSIDCSALSPELFRLLEGLAKHPELAGEIASFESLKKASLHVHHVLDLMQDQYIVRRA